MSDGSLSRSVVDRSRFKVNSFFVGSSALGSSDVDEIDGFEVNDIGLSTTTGMAGTDLGWELEIVSVTMAVIDIAIGRKQEEVGV